MRTAPGNIVVSGEATLLPHASMRCQDMLARSRAFVLLLLPVLRLLRLCTLKALRHQGKKLRTLKLRKKGS